MAKQANVISHWSQLIENFQTSSLDFYTSVERAVGTRAVPEIHWSRVEHKEGGLASANREYVRMHRGKHAFDICAAPFGTGFFISWWFTEPPLRFGFLYTVAVFFGVLIAADIAYTMGFALGIAISGFGLGFLMAGAGVFLGVPLLLWLIGNGLRQGIILGESMVLAMPLVGWLYERVFAPATFYNLDTALMFQEAVHNAVLEVLDCVTADKGVRALTEAERKPIMKRLAASV
ncbi:MAG TPA: hypothetical protein VGN17_05265 [Bryobacteraceae bacterium]|jgi:hypothetical protein